MNVIKELYQYREMISSLVRKDLRGRYKGSVLGFLWTFLNPLLQLAVYTAVFSTVLRMNIEKYHLFLFVALIPWLFFSACLTGGAGAVLDQKEMVKKIYFPREVLPISYVTSCFFNMLFCFAIVLALVIWERVPLSLGTLVYLPLVMLAEYALGLAICFITSALTVYLRDLQHILGIVAMAWMYLTPIMYSIDFVPERYRLLFRANPMLPIIEGYRSILYYGEKPLLGSLLAGLCVSLALLVLGVLIFGKLKRRFAEEL